MRVVLESACPVPPMAWPGPALPTWAGSLDLMVALGSYDAPAREVYGLAKTARRGATVIAATPDESTLAAANAGPLTTHLPTPPDDLMVATIAVLALLGQLELGPEVDAELVVSAAGTVAVRCPPARPLGNNPSKDLAVGLADSFPLAWGGATLAGRVSRQIAETLRRASGRLTPVTDAEKLEAVLLDTLRRDAFIDPFERDAEIGSALLLFDVDQMLEPMMETVRKPAHPADCIGTRVCCISSGMAELGAPGMECCVTPLPQGRYATIYLGIGLGLAQGWEEKAG